MFTNNATVALTPISAYIKHTNLAVRRKIMEAMRAAYAKNGIRSQHVSKQNMTQTITEHARVCERKACIVCKERFVSLSNRLVNLVVIT